MRELNTPHNRFFLLAFLFEGGLAVVALVLGRFVGSPPLATVRFEIAAMAETAIAAGLGIVASVPMFVGLLAIERWSVAPLQRLRCLVDELLVPLFKPLSVTQLLLVSVAAGVGEEMLFRGWLQAGLADLLGPPLGLAVALGVASLLFGVCHWLTTAYALLAALVGLYLGWLFVLTGNLLTPIVAHAAYDFLALCYLVRWRPPS
jgi:membrane protease YdiL (CAAX protease family)